MSVIKKQRAVKDRSAPDGFSKRDHLSRDGIEELVAAMRKLGVANFKLDGLEVTFSPTVYSAGASEGDLDAFAAAERVKSAVKEFNRVNDEDDINLNWST